jgi:hypothetical protein
MLRAANSGNVFPDPCAKPYIWFRIASQTTGNPATQATR